MNLNVRWNKAIQHVHTIKLFKQKKHWIQLIYVQNAHLKCYKFSIKDKENETYWLKYYRHEDMLYNIVLKHYFKRK